MNSQKMERRREHRKAKLVIASQKIYEAKVAALTVHVLTFMLQQHIYIGARASSTMNL
jgi:hypothetical protein